jgi:hypothetical protein
LEQRPDDWCKTAAQAKARLGNSNDAPKFSASARDLALFNLAIDSKLRGLRRRCR